MRSFAVSGFIVDAFQKEIFKGEIKVENGIIVDIIEKENVDDQFILPGLIDAHIHIESSMLVPSEFAKAAVKHGTVGVVADPHEIANVLGVDGIDFMIQNAKDACLHFFFGAPSCVPASDKISAGATLNELDVEKLLQRDDIYFLAEVMDFPGVIQARNDIMYKINAALKLNKPIDGHAPSLMGKDLETYIQRGIVSDHESYTLDEAREKIHLGMKIMIREGSAAKNFTALSNLIDLYPNHVMLCSDDLHPDDLVKGHINVLFRKGLENQFDLFNLVKAASINPVLHYNLPVGLLRKNDPADFIIVDNLIRFTIQKTYCKGKLCFDVHNDIVHKVTQVVAMNVFNTVSISIKDVEVTMPNKEFTLNTIQLIENQLLTVHLTFDFRSVVDFKNTSLQHDLLKLVCLNRYQASKPFVAYVKGFNFKKGAIASSISHDSHNILAVGTNDLDIVEAINTLISSKGGISIAENGIFDCLPLPVAGIMSSQKAEKVASDYEYFNHAAKNLGTNLQSPFMTLSFLALPVIPDIKITDQGLFSVSTNQYIELISHE